MKKGLLIAALGLSCAVAFTSCDKDNKKDEPVVKIDSQLAKEVAEKLTKVGATDAVKQEIGAWATKSTALEMSKDEAKEGKEGFLPDGKKKRFVNANGVEVSQLVAKGMIGAYQLQGYTTRAYSAMNAREDAAKRKALFEEAVSYLLGDMNFKKADGTYKNDKDYKKEGNSFGKYLCVISQKSGGKYEGIANELYTAIEEGVNTTVAKGGNEFIGTLAKIGTIANKVIAFRGVHYLAKYGEAIRTKMDGHSVHELSEGLGFIYSLQFAYNYEQHGTFMLSAEDAKAITEVNLWEEAKKSADDSKLDKMAEQVAGLFGFTVAEAKA